MFFLPKSENMKNWLWLKVLIAVFFILLLVSVATYLIFEEIYKNRIYPGLTINQIDLSGLSQEKAKKILEEKTDKINQNGLKFKFEEEEITVGPIISS